MGRFSQAISEGDGISVIPILDGADVAAARAQTDLPIIVSELIRDEQGMHAAHAGGADACILVVEKLEDEGEMLEELHAQALELGLDCALDVRDEEELERVLELVDPEILVLSERDPDKDEAELERTLDLLPDVPAGKLVVSESPVTTREQILALERAGVDAVLLGLEVPAATLAELTGRS